MEYSDSLIPSAENFAKMAKEYTSRLKREKLFRISCDEMEEQLIDDIFSFLKYLNWLYGYIKKNVRVPKIKSIFKEMEEECISNIEKMENQFFSDPKSSKITKPRNKINNFHSCAKIAIFKEAELIQRFIVLIKYEECQFIIDIIDKHLGFIKNLAAF